MKRGQVILVITLVLTLGSCQKDLEKEDLKTAGDKVSYSLGVLVGKSYQKQSININEEFFNKGMKDGLKGQALYQDKELYQIINEYHKEKRSKDQQDKRAETKTVKKIDASNKKTRAEYENQKAVSARSNLEEGEAFLAKNRLNEGTIVTNSGLQYRILEKGTGEIPGEKDSVTIEYEGRLINGKVFDSSKFRKKAAVFPVNKTVAGMKEALLMMPVGSKWELFIPPELAYGKIGAGHVIGPNATIIFSLKLLSIQVDNN